MGGQENVSGVRDFAAADTTLSSQYLRVKLSGDHTVTVAGATDDAIGTNRNVATTGDHVAVKLLNRQGTMMFVANAAITQNVRVYAAASGKVSPTLDGRFIGYALEAASGDGSVIEVALFPETIGIGMPTETETVKTGNYSVLAADFGTKLIANGAGEVDFTLPAPTAANVGAKVEFLSMVDQIMGILGAGATDIIALNNAAAASVKFQTGGQKIGARAIAEQITATKWHVSAVGGLTVTIA